MAKKAKKQAKPALSERKIKAALQAAKMVLSDHVQCLDGDIENCDVVTSLYLLPADAVKAIKAVKAIL